MCHELYSVSFHLITGRNDEAYTGIFFYRLIYCSYLYLSMQVVMYHIDKCQYNKKEVVR